MIDKATLGKAGLAVMLVAALALSGCGRRGALEPPPEASALSNPDEAPSAQAPGTAAQPQRPPVRQKPDRPFALDFLL